MLVKQLCANAYRVVGQVPEQADVMIRAVQWVSALGDPPALAKSPHAV